MNYYVLKNVTNTQGQDADPVCTIKKDPEQAIVLYHQWLAPLHNADDVLYAVVEILDGDGRIVGGESGYREVVDHRLTPEPEM